MKQGNFYFRHYKRQHIQFILFPGQEMWRLYQLNMPIYLRTYDWDPKKQLPFPGHPKYREYSQMINQTKKEYQEVIAQLQKDNRKIDYWSIINLWDRTIERAKETFLEEFIDWEIRRKLPLTYKKVLSGNALQDFAIYKRII